MNAEHSNPGGNPWRLIGTVEDIVATLDATTSMKPQPDQSLKEVLAGLVERVTFHNAENGFCVLRVKARSHRDLVTVIGHAATISAGEWITASGEWVNDPVTVSNSKRASCGAQHRPPSTASRSIFPPA